MSGNPMYTIQSHCDEKWTKLNLTVAKDPKLSWKAKGLHMVLITMPPGWEVHESDLLELTSTGRDSTRSTILELIKFGYAYRETIRSETGKFHHNELHVYEEPINGKPGTGKPDRIETLNTTTTTKSSIYPSDKHMRFPPHKPQRIATKNDDRRNPHQHQKDKALVESLTKIPTTIQPIIDKWFAVAKTHKQGTKALRDGVTAVKAIRAGILFKNVPNAEEYIKPYSDKQILKALDRFGIMRNNNDYNPTNKEFLKRLSLAQFFYSPFANSNNGGPPSVFLNCLKTPPKLTADLNPELTSMVQVKWTNLNGGTLHREVAMYTSNRLARYWEQNTSKLKGWGILNQKNLINKWVQWFVSTNKDPSHLGAPYMQREFEKHTRQMQT